MDRTLVARKEAQTFLFDVYYKNDAVDNIKLNALEVL